MKRTHLALVAGTIMVAGLGWWWGRSPVAPPSGPVAGSSSPPEPPSAPSFAGPARSAAPPERRVAPTPLAEQDHRERLLDAEEDLEAEGVEARRALIDQQTQRLEAAAVRAEKAGQTQRAQLMRERVRLLQREKKRLDQDASTVEAAP